MIALCGIKQGRPVAAPSADDLGTPLPLGRDRRLDAQRIGHQQPMVLRLEGVALQFSLLDPRLHILYLAGERNDHRGMLLR